jgi:hypothetical protein
LPDSSDRKFEVDDIRGAKLEDLSSGPLEINHMEETIEARWTLSEAALTASLITMSDSDVYILAQWARSAAPVFSECGML